MIVQTDFDLTTYNSYKVESKCKRVSFPESEKDILDIFKEKRSELPIVIGGGYNVILSKAYYEKDFIIFSKNFSNVAIEGQQVTAQAGSSLYDLSLLAYEASLSGLEIFYDIPSSLGGAIVMNAGASGEDIKGLLVKVKYFDPYTLTFNVKYKEDIDFEYRNSFFQKNPHFIIVEATLNLKSNSQQYILNKMESSKSARWAKQPKDFPNAGSVFKRPKNFYVGAIIDELNLKGHAFGGAKVSEKHGGFIINYNNATGNDIVNLINDIKAKVFSAYNIDLEVEQRII